MSIISAVASSVQLSLAVAAAAWDVYDLDYFGCYYVVGFYLPGSKVDVRYFIHLLVYSDSLFDASLYVKFLFVTELKNGSVCGLFTVLNSYPDRGGGKGGQVPLGRQLRSSRSLTLAVEPVGG